MPDLVEDSFALAPCPVGYKRFDVALWGRWPLTPLTPGPVSFPEHVMLIDAIHAFAAIEFLMQYHHRSTVAYACARALDGSLVYRCYRPRIVLSDEEEQVYEETSVA